MATKQELLKAKQLLEQHAPKGEFLAYINKDEAQVLKNLGGSGRIVEATQIPSYEVQETRQLVNPTLEASLTNFLKKVDPLVGQTINKESIGDGRGEGGVGSCRSGTIWETHYFQGNPKIYNFVIGLFAIP